ncbi:Cytochrome P450 monooxygenase ABA1 [Paramyrothecium foliicola]|nr:Cytochrome P450 monooxygenase ABA1 [Paramyrothecium foliicola]
MSKVCHLSLPTLRISHFNMELWQYASLLTLRNVGAVLVGLLLASYVKAWYRLRHIKGPFLASFSYLWIFRATAAEEQYDRYGAVFEKYGKLVRIGPNDVITGSADIINRMSSARSRYLRSDYYKGARLNPAVESLVNITDTPVHDKLKAQMSHGYGGKEVPTLEDDVDEQVFRFINLLRAKYVSTKTFAPVDLSALAHYFTLDVITKLAYGRAFGHLDNERDMIGYLKDSASGIKIAVLCGEIPIMRKIFMNPLAVKLFGPKPTDSHGMGSMIGYAAPPPSKKPFANQTSLAQKVVSKRFEPDAEDQRDMLGSFIRHGVSQDQCEAEVPFQILAGSDTTAHAIRGTLLCLMTTAHTYRKFQEEIDDAASRGKISRPVRLDEAKQLPYVQAVIYEGLRLNPPASLLAMKQTPPEGDTIDGIFVPGGVRVAVSVKPIMLDKGLFGDDVELFRPERWLGLDPKQRRVMAESVELVFGTGRWGCSGKSVAFIELNKIFIELLRNFDFQLVNPRQPVESRRNLNVWYEKGMWVKVTERVK